MMSDPLMLAGLQLMLVGMGTVFVFLTLLVFVVKLMSLLVEKFAPTELSQTAKSSGQVGLIPPAHVAAVTAAIDQHRRR